MQQLIKELGRVVEHGRVITDANELAFYAQDVFTSAAPAGVVVSPASTAELAAAVQAATSAGHAVVTRGGGMSYTSGYVPAEQHSVHRRYVAHGRAGGTQPRRHVRDRAGRHELEDPV